MIFLYFLCGLYFLGMLFILIYSLAQGHLLFHFLKAQRSWGKIAKKIPKDWPSVTVQLPVYNELYVVERLIEAVAKLNYPRELLEIQLLDDSTDQTVDLIREKLKKTILKSTFNTFIGGIELASRPELCGKD